MQEKADPDTAEADRERVGNYVERAAPRALAKRDVPWKHAVTWDEQEIRITLTRGELVITRGLRHGGPPEDAWAEGEEGPWWTPVTKKWADELARRLAHFAYLSWLPFRDVDATGRLHVTVWPTPGTERRYQAKPVEGVEPLRVVLEPGLMVEPAISADTLVVRRFLESPAGTLAEALEWGGARVENS